MAPADSIRETGPARDRRRVPMTDVRTDTDAAIRALLDKQAIRDVMMRYCRGVDRLDADLISSAYHPDAYDDHCGEEFTGETVGPGIARWMGETMEMTSHQITNQTVALDGDFAGCESYYTETHILKAGDGPRAKGVVVGRYVDRLERRDGEWRIIHRRVVMESGSDLPIDEYSERTVEKLWTTDRSDPSYDVLEHPTPAG
jgi:hypothetical protein